MNYKRLNILLLLMLQTVLVYGQNNITISGYIRDSTSAENLYNATVFEKESLLGTISNAYGFYSLTVPKGMAQLTVSFVGYKQQKLVLEIRKDTTINFKLTAKNDLQEVVVKAQSVNQKRTFAGHEQINLQTVKALPGFAGEQDVLKSLTILPGVQQGHEGSAGLFVRGGSPDQNLILLDGVPIFNATHLFGFVSVFTPEAIQSVDFYKGGFPAQYGGRLSSVVDVRMKEGNKNKSQTDLTLGIITSKFTHEGPIKKGKSSYLISARRTLLDLFVTGVAKISQASNDEVIVPGLNLYDFNAKLNFDLNTKNRLYVSFYGGGDLLSSQFKNTYTFGEGEAKQKTKVKLKWGNKIGAMRWTSQLSSKMYLNTTLSTGIFKYNIHNKYNQTVKNNDGKEKIWSDIEYRTRVNTNKLQFLFDWYKNQHKIQFGASGEINSFIPGQQSIDRHDGTAIKRGQAQVNNNGLACFIDDKFSIGDKLTLQGGLRLDLYDLHGKWYSYLSPRLNTKLAVSHNCNLFLSYAQMAQPLHLLTNSGIGFPSDIWVPASENVEPETSKQITLGTEMRLNQQLNYKLDSYYKKMNNVINYRAGQSFMDIYDNWEDLVESGTGEAWGFENSLNYNTARFKSWINYTLSWNNRRFKNINNGQVFPYKFDRRHDINLGCIYKINENIECSAVWVLQSGQAATIPMQDYAAAEPTDYTIDAFITNDEIKDVDRIQYFENHNDYRLPAFHHLDIGITFKRQRENFYNEWKLGVYNVYARQNPYMYYQHTTPAGDTKYKQVCIFPIIPSISYHIRF